MHSILTLYTGCVTPQHRLPAGRGRCTALASPSLSSRAFQGPSAAEPRHRYGTSHADGQGEAWWLLPGHRDLSSPWPPSFSRTTTWWKTFLQPSCPVWPRKSCEQRCPVHEPLASSSPKLVFGAFPLKTTFAVRMHIKALSKVSSRSCFLAPAQGSTGWLTSPVIHWETITEQYQRTAWLLISQSRKDVTVPQNKGEWWCWPTWSGLPAWAGRSGPWWLGRDQETSGSWRGGSRRELDSPPEPCGLRHPALLPARAHATSGSPAAGAPLQTKMALGGLTPRGWHLDGDVCHPSSLAPGTRAG